MEAWFEARASKEQNSISEKTAEAKLAQEELKEMQDTLAQVLQQIKEIGGPLQRADIDYYTSLRAFHGTY
jgi:chromosome segregation ATPase